MGRALVLTDLGFGDSGKGTTTHWLCCRTGAQTVVRTGGPQAMHNVVTADDRYHMFSQFGSGTLVGAKTYLSQYMVIDPYAILSEGRALRDEQRINDIFRRIAIHEDALVITPFHAVANRLRELARGPNRYGTVGIGVGEAVLDSESHPEETIRAKDFGTPELSAKLEAVRERKLRELQEVLDTLSDLPKSGARDVATLHNPEVVRWAASEFNYLGTVVPIVDDDFLRQVLREDVVVFEPSQGVLLDRWLGFHPYTTKVDSTGGKALDLLQEQGFSGEVIRLAITRAYQTRHGAGPFVTENPELTRAIPDLHNGEHEWQGSFRVGQLDAVALRYAIQACGGPKAFDGLVVTCLDRLIVRQPWQVCTSYTLPQTKGLDEFFLTKGSEIKGIRVRPNTRDKAHLDHQEQLSQRLWQCQPRFSAVNLIESRYEDWFNSVRDKIGELLGIPVAVTSFGMTERDKREVEPLHTLRQYTPVGG